MEVIVLEKGRKGRERGGKEEEEREEEGRKKGGRRKGGKKEGRKKKALEIEPSLAATKTGWEGTEEKLGDS